jgi:hypothetical protein
MTTAEIEPGRFGLSDLSRVPLLEAQELTLERLRETSQGSASWRGRKDVEARELMACERIAERMTLLGIEAATELRALVRLRVAVPCMPPGCEELVVEDEAVLALVYPEDILSRPLPGYALVAVVTPHHVHHPNCAAGAGVQPLCLGAAVPRGLPLREALVSSYAALTLQAITVDERDSAGLMNPKAGVWWQANMHRIPLSRDPFLSPLARSRDRVESNTRGGPATAAVRSQP